MASNRGLVLQAVRDSSDPQRRLMGLGLIMAN